MEKKTILLIDDSADLVEAMSEILELKGYNTIIAQRGEEGISKAITSQPDLILLDLRMPDLSGYDVIRHLRKDAWGKTAKILILTASGESDGVPEDIDFDRNDFLMKTDWGLHNIAEKIAEKLAE